MREIKFRAWTGDRMFEPYYFERAYDGYEMPYKCYEDWRDLEDGRSQFCEIMQYTGLKDKNGKEIYEGDIVKWDDRSSGQYWRVAIVGIDPDIQFRIIENTLHELSCTEGYIFHYGNFAYRATEKELYVIGNIYETPELLKP